MRLVSQPQLSTGMALQNISLPAGLTASGESSSYTKEAHRFGILLIN